MCVLSNSAWVQACSCFDTLSGSWKYFHNFVFLKRHAFQYDLCNVQIVSQHYKDKHPRSNIHPSGDASCELKSKQVLQINSSIRLIGTIWSFRHIVGAFSAYSSDCSCQTIHWRDEIQEAVMWLGEIWSLTYSPSCCLGAWLGQWPETFLWGLWEEEETVFREWVISFSL